jgi:hypothetical protein
LQDDPQGLGSRLCRGPNDRNANQNGDDEQTSQKDAANLHPNTTKPPGQCRFS